MEPIDYDGGARAYRAARTLPPPILESWRKAVLSTALPPVERVVDIGAGTGQFLGPLAEWFDAQVVGVEPSPGMREEARSVTRSPQAALVAGRAEQLPLRHGSVDLAWLSTVVHQFDDLDRAAGELRRVVRPGGKILVRGLFRDTPVTGLLASFPGIGRSAATFPTTTTVLDTFARRGFAAGRAMTVSERWEFTLGDWMDRAQSLRNIDSALRSLTDDEFAAGLREVQRLAGTQDRRLTSDTTLTLLSLTG